MIDNQESECDDFSSSCEWRGQINWSVAAVFLMQSCFSFLVKMTPDMSSVQKYTSIFRGPCVVCCYCCCSRFPASTKDFKQTFLASLLFLVRSRPTKTTWTLWPSPTARRSCCTRAATTPCARCGTDARWGRPDHSRWDSWPDTGMASPSSTARWGRAECRTHTHNVKLGQSRGPMLIYIEKNVSPDSGE